MIVLDKVLKIWMDLITRNDNTTNKFYLMQTILKMVKKLKNQNISKNNKFIEEGAPPALRNIRAEPG